MKNPVLQSKMEHGEISGVRLPATMDVHTRIGSGDRSVVWFSYSTPLRTSIRRRDAHGARPRHHDLVEISGAANIEA